jgi:hypothetical protein
MDNDTSVHSYVRQPTVMTLSFVFAVVVNKCNCCKYVATGSNTVRVFGTFLVQCIPAIGSKTTDGALCMNTFASHI